jgi:uncharacterized membrane protein YgdD (TMEM256/DUF423 family)
MLELLLLVALVIAMGKVADAENRSPMLWGGLTLLVGIASFFVVPIPFARLLIVGVVMFAGMMVAKATGH